MKESRLIIIVSTLLFIFIGPILYLFYVLFPNFLDYVSIATNLYCGIIVAIVTSVCQFCISKRKIINNIYNAYFDVYRSYYYSKNNSFLFHFNAYSIYKKILELNPKIIESLDEYYGIIKKYDRTYKKLNPIVVINKNYKAKNMLKTLLLWFNKKSYNDFFEPFMDEIENILININQSRFEKDKEEMIKMYKFMWNKEK